MPERTGQDLSRMRMELRCAAPAMPRTKISLAVIIHDHVRCILSDVRGAISARRVSDCRGLVRHLTDLFVVNAAVLGDAEIALFDEVLNGLIHEIDTAARALLALRLAPIGNAPVTLMRTLACGR